MNKMINKIIKSIIIIIAIIMSIVVIVFGASKFINNQKNNENTLNYFEYRIQENEINITEKNTKEELTNYTGEEVNVSINPQILEEVNKNKDDDKKMIVQYQLTELTDTTGVVENKWNDYYGPFSVDHNVRVNARLYSKADEGFTGPVTNKDITQIAVAKIVEGNGNDAKITYYRTLTDAINAYPANTGITENLDKTKIEMIANTKENVVIPQGKNIVLDVAGFKISSENENPTITINGKCNLVNSKNENIGESVISITNIGIKVNSTGEFILGENESDSIEGESNVSTTTPVIKGKIYGIQVEENGKFRFYDGKIIAPADEDETKFGHKAIYGTNPEKENSTTGNKDVYETPQKYIVNIEKDENGNEIATLAKTFVITFDADGGETSISTKIVVGNKEYGDLPVANKVGYEFVKWTYEEKTIEPSTIVTTLKDHTLKANYTPNIYKISFNANTASGKLADIDATYDNETQLPTKSKIIMSYVKNGYSFKNWNTQPDGKGTSYEAGEIVKNLTQINNDVVILYAIWEDTIKPGNQAPTGISTTNTIKITCNQTDEGTGIDENSIQYAIGIDTNQNGTIEEKEWSEWQNSDTFENLNSNTEYSIRTKVSDKAGNGPVISEIGNIKTKNIENAVLEVYKDNETSDQITPETDANNKSNPINTDLKLIVKLPKTDNSIKDDSTNGTSTIIYITGPDGDIKTYQNGNEEGIISNSDGILNINVTTKTGTYEIKITTTDGTNTVEDKYYVFIDKTAPTILPVKTSTTNSITVTANAGDEDSGVRSVTYILKDEEGNIIETNLTGKFVNLKENTKYNVEIIVVDNAGNIGTTVVETATKSLVVGKLEFSGVISKQIIPALKSNPQTSDEKVWTNENVNIKITKPDDVTTTYIVSKNDEIVSDVYSEDTQIATVDGNYVATITTTDGTNIKIENYYFSVDKTAPVVVIEPNGKIQTIAVGNNQDNITATLTVSDEENGSGVVSTKYAVTESNVNEPENWEDFVSGASITQTKPGGVYYIWTNVVDKAGNRATSVKVSDGYDIGYEVEYDVNGGKGTITAQRKAKDTSLTLTNTIPTKDGYLFKGWATSKTATSAEYNASGVYSKNEAVKLYAVWSEVVASATVSGTVTYYDSVQDAIDFLKTNKGTVTLIKDEINESVVIAAGQDVVLDTDGKTLNSEETTVTNNGTLIIQGNGVVCSEKLPVINKSNITIGKCTIKSETSAISNSGNMIVNDAIIEISSNGVNNSGDFIFNSGTLISDGKYTISNWKNVTITGGIISNKYTGNENSYTIICHNRDTINDTYNEFTNVTMTGGLVKATENRDKIAITTSNLYINGTINVSGGTIESTNYGIQNFKGDTNISGGVINGGIYTNTGNINITGGIVKKVININDSGTLTMGINDSDVNTENPVVNGYASISESGKFNFYDGIIKNQSGEKLIAGTVTATPTGYSVVNGTETIDGETYDTAYLSNQYKVIFDTNGGNAVTPANKTLTYGTTYGELPTPTRTGYTFNGWKLKGTETIITSTSTVSTPYEHTLEACWKPTGYDIEYELNGGTSGTLAPTTGNFDSEVYITVPKRTGYKFMGWTSTTEDGLEEGAQEYNGSAYVSWDGSLSTLYNSSSLRSSFKNLIKPQQTEGERKRVKLTANWIPETYNITYDYKGGTAGKLTQSSATLNEEVKISNPSKTGYTFTGWTSTQEDGLSSKALMYDSNKNYSGWDGSLSYTFSFNSSYSGSYFKNLAPQEIGQEEVKTVKLTANWKPDGYDIVYELNGGTAGTLAPTTASFNTEFRIYNPTKSGYTFLGWTSSQEDGLEDGAQASASSWSSWNGSLTKATYFKNLIAQHSTGERKAVKLTANWVPGTYNITYDYKGGTAGGITQSSAALDEVVRISNPSKTGYTFAGWTSTQEDGLNSKALMYDKNGNYTSWDGSLSYTFSFNSSYSGSYFKNLAPQEIGQEEIKTVKLTANWKPSGYNIVYELNGGTAGTLAPTTASFNTEFRIYNPTKSGYTFLGWTSTQEDGLEEGAQASASSWSSWNGSLTKATYFKNLIAQHSTGERKAVKLTANWVPGTYNITYDYKGGTAGGITQSSAALDEVVRISNPSKTGYTFAGWTSSQEDGLNSKALMYDKNREYTSWDGSLSYTFSFNSSYSGSYFKNLAPQEIGQEEIKTVKLTANWKPSGYDIVYELNGGTAGTLAPTTASFNTEFRIYNPTKSGYTFLGWTSTQEDGLEEGAQASASSWSSWNGSLTKATYFKNLIAQHSTGERKAVKLTANWVPGTYNITYDYKGGTAGGITQSSAALDEVVRISNPSKTGYTFAGWTSSQEDGLNSKALMYDKNREYTSWDGSLSYTFSFNSSYSGSYFKNLAPQEIGQEEIKTVKLTANWKPSGYDIIYELNGGKSGSSAPTTGSEGSNISVSAPTKDGYTFAGWTSSKEDGLCDGAQVNIEGSGMAYWDGSLKKVYVFKNLATQKVGEERKTVKLTANWAPSGYDIAYELNGGTAGAVAPTTASFNTEFRIYNPTKDGCTFLGWTSSKEDGLEAGAQAAASSWSSWNGSLTKGTYFKNLIAQQSTGERKTVKLTANWQETSTQSLKTQMLKIQDLKNQVLKNQSSVTGNSVGGTENEEISSGEQTMVEQPTSEETSTEISSIEQTSIVAQISETQTPVAQINETTYKTLSEAINSSNNQDQITILENLNLEEIIITSDKNITINLNGKTITSTSINTINNKGTLTITGPGIIKNEIENGTVIYNTGTINIENNAQITATKNGGKGISCSVDGYINENSAENQKDKSGILNMKSGKITTEGIGSIGIYNIKGGIVNIIDGTIETTGFGGKAIYNNADLKINKIKILIDGDDSVGIYNSRNSKTCVLNNTEITIQKKEIENYEIIKNTNEFKAQLEEMKPSYGIYNDSNTDVTFETGVIKIERLKGIGIKNNFEGSVTLGKEDETINSASPIIYAICDNTTAIINNENGEIRFYDGKIVSVESVKKCFTNLLKNSEIVEETGNSNIACYLKMCE